MSADQDNGDLPQRALRTQKGFSRESTRIKKPFAADFADERRSGTTGIYRKGALRNAKGILFTTEEAEEHRE
jgi:hypothetical protein